MVVHHAVETGGRRVNVESGGGVARDAEDVGDGGGGGEGRGVSGCAIPAREAVVEIGKAGHAAVFAVFALEAELGVGPEAQRAGQGDALELGEIAVAPAATILPDGVGANGEAVVEGLVDVDGDAAGVPRAEGGAELADGPVEAGLFRDDVGGAGLVAVAEEDGVGAAGEVVAFEVVAVEIDVEREEIALGRGGADAARGVGDVGGEGEVGAVVVVHIGVYGPLDGTVEIGEVEGVDELARDHGVGGGGVGEIAGEAAASEGTGGDKADVFVGADGERREGDGLGVGFGRGWRGGRDGGALGDCDRSDGENQGEKGGAVGDAGYGRFHWKGTGRGVGSVERSEVGWVLARKNASRLTWSWL